VQPVLGRLDVLAPNWFHLDRSSPTRIAGDSQRRVLSDATGAGTAVWPVVNGQVRDLPGAFTAAVDRGAFCTNLRGLAARLGTAGMTLDLEGFDVARGPAFSDLVRRCADGLHADGRSLAVYLPRRTDAPPNRANGAYDWQAVSAAADLVVASTYSEAWERPGPMTTVNGLQRALLWDASVSTAKVAPIVGTFGLRWVGTAEPRLIAQRDAESDGTRVGPLTRDDTGGTYSTADPGIVRFSDAATTARSLGSVRAAGFTWAAIFTVGREDPALWSLLPAGVGR
jgi:spore germination protein YaaH